MRENLLLELINSLNPELEYIDKIGLSRKESRLRDLHTYVKKKLKHNKRKRDSVPYTIHN